MNLIYGLDYMDNRRMKGSKRTQLRLPVIAQAKTARGCLTHRLAQQLQNNLDKENEQAQVEQLEQWTARNYQSIRQEKPRQQNRPYRKESLYREFQRQAKKTKTILLQNTSLLVEPKLYLFQLEQKLNKVHDINYLSIYKNTEYCSSLYAHFYGDILQALQKFIASLSGHCQQLQSSIVSQRIEHIKSMDRLSSSLISSKMSTSQTREQLQTKQGEVDTIQVLLEQLRKARQTVLKHALRLGYDVREDGLLWIIRELAEVPSAQQFPSFLNEKEIQFIRNRYARELNQQGNNSSILAESGKTAEQIADIVTRKKKRELSMVKQGDILQQLQNEHSASLSSERHKYINQDILQMAEEGLPRTKSTKYEIIYKEAVRKLNKYCLNQIYKQGRDSRKDKDIMGSRKQSFATLNILSHFQSKVQDYMRQANQHAQLLNEEEKELDDIVKGLRYEVYHDSGRVEGSRNAISVLCCLLGQHKAKRIVEQQLNHLF